MMKILLVDDERMEREGIAYLCRNKNYDFIIEEAINGKDALDKVSLSHFDIVIVDVKMPVMGGLEFLEKAVTISPKTKYIIYSGYSDFEYAREAISLKVYDYILKPMDENSFYKIIDKLILNIEEEKNEFKKDMIYKSINGLNSDNDFKNVCGFIILMYFENRVLDTKSDIINNIIKNIFKESYLFLENEHECFAVVLNQKDKISESVSLIIDHIEKYMNTKSNIMISKEFTDDTSMQKNMQECKSVMLPGFFSQKSSFVNFSDIEEVSNNNLILKNLEDISVYKDNIRDSVLKMTESIMADNAYSNMYVKYRLVKQIENTVEKISPKHIEKLLNSHNIDEFRNIAEEIMLDSQPKNNVINTVKEYIKSHYFEDIGIDDIATSVFLNSAYLSTLFRKETGQTLISYLTDYRMQMAKHMVINTFMKYTDISKQVGYQNVSYFNIIFKNKFGKTPSELRRGKDEE